MISGTYDTKGDRWKDKGRENSKSTTTYLAKVYEPACVS